MIPGDSTNDNEYIHVSGLDIEIEDDEFDEPDDRNLCAESTSLAEWFRLFAQTNNQSIATVTYHFSFVDTGLCFVVRVINVSLSVAHESESLNFIPPVVESPEFDSNSRAISKTDYK